MLSHLYQFTSNAAWPQEKQMDLAAFATELETIQANRPKRGRYSRQVVLDRQGTLIFVGGRDKGRGANSACPRMRHNDASGAHVMHPAGHAESETQARMICAGLMRFYNEAGQTWPTELYDERTSRRYKPSARAYIPAAVQERVIERPNADHHTTAQRLAAFIDAAREHSGALTAEDAQRDAERALEIAAPMFRLLAARYPLTPAGQINLRLGTHVCCVDFAADRESGDPRRLRRAAIQNKRADFAEQVKAVVREQAATSTDPQITEADLLAALHELESTPVEIPAIPSDLFAYAQ